MKARHALAPVVILLLATAVAPLAANEAFVRTAGGNATLRRASETTVRMRAEYINISLCDDYYEVDALFVFDNPGDTVTHEVGFPRFSAGDVTGEGFRDFESWVNDQPVEAIEIPAAGGSHDTSSAGSSRTATGTEPGAPSDSRTAGDGGAGNGGARVENPSPRIDSYFVRDIEFPSGELTTTRVRYRADYGRDRLFRTLRYLYGTAHTWAGELDTMTVRIHNNSGRWIDHIRYDGISIAERGGEIAFATQGARDFDLIKTDVDPDPEATIDLYIERYPWWIGDPLSSDVSDDWIFDSVLVKSEYLRLLTLRQLRIFRNTFFARNGLDFGDSELGRYFAQFRWYEPRTGSTDGLLNEVEEENVRSIRAEEERRGSFVR